MTERLIDRLGIYNKTTIPMHMPGHKRNTDMADYLVTLAADRDVTELPDFDDLHHASGILHDSMKLASKLYGADHTYFLINGSTCGNISGIMATAGHGGKVIVGRNCHRSIYHGMQICQNDPYFLYPEVEALTGAHSAVDPQMVKKALQACPDAKLVAITSPTFEGVVSDVKAICEIAHSYGVPVMVDEAHGAHFGFGYGFPQSAVTQGADIIIQSLHKTLPSLTQTALIHVNDGFVDHTKVAYALAMIESSSPSYVLMSSIDGCIHLLDEKGPELFEAWQKNLEYFYDKIKDLKRLHLMTKKDIPACAVALDPSKIVICTSKAGMSGVDLMTLLREKYHIEGEMASERYVNLMCGLGDTKATYDAVADALIDIDECLEEIEHPKTIGRSIYPDPMEAKMPAYKAMVADREGVSIEQSIGRISAEYVWAYPPGVPLFIPGECIDENCTKLFSAYEANKIKLRSTSREFPNCIYVVKE